MSLKLIIQGFIVGIGKIIPGVSGAMMAMLMGIYEPLMEAITKFFDDKKKHFYLLFNFGIGLFLAIVLFSKVILFLLTNYYHITIYLFLGLIMGTVLRFRKQVSFNRKNMLLFLVSFLFAFLIPFFESGELFVFQNNIFHYLYVILLGGIDAVTSIIPGISGTAIFMMMGSYEFVLNVLGHPFSFSFFLYFLGLVGGAVLTCIIMYYLFKRWRSEVNAVIFAFSLASVLLLFLNVCHSISLFLIIIFIGGMFLGYLFDK